MIDYRDERKRLRHALLPRAIRLLLRPLPHPLPPPPAPAPTPDLTLTHAPHPPLQALPQHQRLHHRLLRRRKQDLSQLPHADTSSSGGRGGRGECGGMVWGYGVGEEGRVGGVGVGDSGGEVWAVAGFDCGGGFVGVWVEGLGGEEEREEKAGGWDWGKEREVMRVWQWLLEFTE